MITIQRSAASKAAEAARQKERVIEQINKERDRRLAAGFMFQGKLYDFDAVSKSRIAGAATLAGFAIFSGAQPGNMQWHGGDTDFLWVAADNSLNPMDAQTVFAFGQTAAEFERAMIFRARALKDADPIPENYTDDTHWT